MKKLNLVLITLLIFFVSFTKSYAMDYEYYVTKSSENDLREIEEQSEDIIRSMNALPKGKKFEDLKWDKALRLYIGPEIFKNDKLTEKELKEILENCETWFWVQYSPTNEEIEMLRNGNVQTYDYTIYKQFDFGKTQMKMYNITKENLEYYKKHGKWVTQGYSQLEYKFNYKEAIKYILKKNKISPKKLYIVSVQLNLSRSFLVYFDENEEIKFLDLNDIHLQYIKDVLGIVNEKNEKDLRIFYSYEELKKEADYIKESNKNVGNSDMKGGGMVVSSNVKSNKTIIYASIATIIILGVSFVVIRKRKNK